MNTTIDLSRFCDPECRGYDLSNPFVKCGWLYATDGRVCVRMPAAGEHDTVSDRRLPDCASLFNDTPNDYWFRWPKVPVCDECEGRGITECSKCGGDGRCSRCACDKEHDCGYCDGTGEDSCDMCLTEFDFRFGETVLSHKYAYRIAQLPNVEYAPGGERGGKLWFRFDVMGVRSK